MHIVLHDRLFISVNTNNFPCPEVQEVGAIIIVSTDNRFNIKSKKNKQIEKVSHEFSGDKRHKDIVTCLLFQNRLIFELQRSVFHKHRDSSFDVPFLSSLVDQSTSILRQLLDSKGPR